MGPGSFGCATQLFVFPCIQEPSAAVDVEPQPVVEHVERKPEVVQDDHRVVAGGGVLFSWHVLVHTPQSGCHRESWFTHGNY